jgi:aminoglycoside phosphotransferase family enzyme
VHETHASWVFVAGERAYKVKKLVHAYRDAGMDPGDETLRSFYAAHWALVWAKVTLIAAAEHDGAARMEAAAACTAAVVAQRATVLACRGAAHDRGLRTGRQRQVVRWLLDRDGQITITLPAGHASPDDLAQALQTAA